MSPQRRENHPGTSPRAAFSLIELLVAMTLAIAFLLVGFQLLSLVTDVVREDAVHWERELGMQRLGDRWRADVAEASGVRLLTTGEAETGDSVEQRRDGVGAGCELTQRDGALVVYRAFDEHIERTRTEGGRRQEFDRYMLPDATVQFSRSGRIMQIGISLDQSVSRQGLARNALIAFPQAEIVGVIRSRMEAQE